MRSGSKFPDRLAWLLSGPDNETAISVKLDGKSMKKSVLSDDEENELLHN